MKEKQLLSFIKNTIDQKGEPPTVNEMKDAIGVRSTASLYRNLDLLESKGLIRREKGWRGISLTAEYEEESSLIKIPLLGIVAAGNPIEAILVPEFSMVPKDMLVSGKNHFALRVRGESMIDENIVDGDLIILREARTASNGEIVVALIDGQDATVKTFRLEGNKVHLIPANKNYQTIVADAKRVAVQGVVVGLLRYF